jgi:signal transduction histidine kinase
VHEPTPEQYNPPLTWRAHVWRSLGVLAISGLVCTSTVPAQLRENVMLLWVDLGLGVVAFVLSFFRRRWPLTVAVLTNAVGALSASSAGAGTLASVSLATRRQVWQIVFVGIVAMAATQTFWIIEPRGDNGPWWVNFAVGMAFTIAILVWGMYIGSRRELLWTLRDRAERAEAEQALRVAQGRSNERARIAREMHDVLAHRISLISMHAGALAYRTDLTADEVRETAELLQTKSHEALTDLRQVLGVLRGDEAVAAGLRERPQPTFEDLDALIGEAEQSGMRVQYDDRVLDPASMPERVGRTTYRIIQEGLTNARKHAPGVRVLVRVAGSPADGIDITVRNPARSLLAPRNGSGTPGAGLGLVGLGERAKLAGGRLETRVSAGNFELHGWLPWEV